MGRSSIRGSPVSTQSTLLAAKAAHKGRIAVPAFPKNSSSGSATLNAPPLPLTVQRVLSSLSVY